MCNKYDLCSDTVTLDYSELIKTAEVAVHYSLEELSQRLRKWYNINSDTELTNLDADWMLQNAQSLATATTTLHYLTEGLEREEVVVVREIGKEVVEY